MQYVAIGLLAGGASLVTVALTTLMVNARHLFYGISMLEKYKKTDKRKAYLIFTLTDETYSLVCNDDLNIPVEERNNYYFLVSFFNHMYWVIGSVLGAFMGSVVKFNSEGIDFALTALFLTVFIEQWLSTKKHAPAIIGVAITVICLVLFGKDNFLIPTIMGMLVVYCLKDISFISVSTCLPQLLACMIVGILYVWKRNTLISIISGTVRYMLLVQLVF